VGLFEEPFVNNENTNPFLNKVLKWYQYIDSMFLHMRRNGKRAVKLYGITQ
jgi:hypothetical protein